MINEIVYANNINEHPSNTNEVTFTFKKNNDNVFREAAKQFALRNMFGLQYKILWVPCTGRGGGSLFIPIAAPIKEKYSKTMERWNMYNFISEKIEL